MNEHSNEWIPWHWHLWRVLHYVTCINIFYRNLMFNLHWFDENQKTNQYLSICHPNKLLILQLENLGKWKKVLAYWNFQWGYDFIYLYISLVPREKSLKLTHFLITWDILMTFLEGNEKMKKIFTQNGFWKLGYELCHCP